jgi:hypothetical protein
MKGSITGDVTLDQVAQDVVLRVGEIVLTSGAGGNYPATFWLGRWSMCVSARTIYIKPPRSNLWLIFLVSRL